MEKRPLEDDRGMISPYNTKVNKKPMRRLFFSLVFLYGVGLSMYFGSWGVRDMAALENAVASGSHHEEMRHRLNVSAEGNWFLLANLIAITGALGTIGTSKNDD